METFFSSEKSFPSNPLSYRDSFHRPVSLTLLFFLAKFLYSEIWNITEVKWVANIFSFSFYWKENPNLGQQVQKQACCLAVFFKTLLRPLPVGQEGKGNGGRERRRDQGDIPQTCQDIPRETIPNISHCDPHCVRVCVSDWLLFLGPIWHTDWQAVCTGAESEAQEVCLCVCVGEFEWESQFENNWICLLERLKDEEGGKGHVKHIFFFKRHRHLVWFSFFFFNLPHKEQDPGYSYVATFWTILQLITTKIAYLNRHVWSLYIYV